jgi:hypothetical protein
MNIKINVMSRGSSVNTVSAYKLNYRATGVRSPEKEKDYFLASVFITALRPTQPPVHWVLGVLSPWVNRGRGVVLTTHLHLMLSL